MTHLQIGKKLLAQTANHANDNLQTILHHLNIGLKMMTSDEEKLKQEASTQHICIRERSLSSKQYHNMSTPL